MLARIRVTLTWQRLIGLASGMFGGAVSIATAANLSIANSLGVLSRPPDFISAICGCVFLFLAFPLYAGREWARRALLVLTYCVLGTLAISVFIVVILPRSRATYTSVHPVLGFVIGLCALVAFLTPPAFVLAVLHHADVRRSFQPHDASNQTLQPTADRPNV
jgi:hypothetical protein